MRNFILLFSLFLIIFSCDKEVILNIKSQEDLDKNITNSYIKVVYKTNDLEQQNCKDFVFEFDDVEVITLSKSEFNKISEGLINAKLSSSQNIPKSDFYLEYRGYAFCVNHLGNIIRNNRRMNDDLDLTYLIKSKADYYNHFSKDNLIKNDTLISRFGLPFSYKEVDKTLDKKTKKNIILTF